MRYLIRLSYDGTAFCGWQIQQQAPSVQDCLQQALALLLKRETPVTGAGRTDTGVHAVGYAAHFDAADLCGLDPEQFIYKLNAILPRSVTVHGVFPAEESFHARFDAVRREYSYFVHRGKDPFIEAWSLREDRPLDMAAMNRAAAQLLGTRDFSCFDKTGGNNKTSICTVFEARWERYTPTHVAVLGYPEGEYLRFHIAADRFLRNMVRATVGTLLEIGRGKQAPEWIDEVLTAGERGKAGESVPGHALFLQRVLY